MGARAVRAVCSVAVVTWFAAAVAAIASCSSFGAATKPGNDASTAADAADAAPFFGVTESFHWDAGPCSPWSATPNQGTAAIDDDGNDRLPACGLCASGGDATVSLDRTFLNPVSGTWTLTARVRHYLDAPVVPTQWDLEVEVTYASGATRAWQSSGALEADPQTVELLPAPSILEGATSLTVRIGSATMKQGACMLISDVDLQRR